eukprot:CAMPEP_0203850708 /NCGR_PEP_ID=MMETSP0359-20131031/6921_1 /ASSEMBLY_ACC=CAM_ASM_000338 /TAXON_ID=268821 /ORGANISM="Scrippsiella Hangoei, Strain SHTV-5" /LENGTH=69 /DNA_ID=CAMNT_0050766621 /DNA_START=159 /DNA_END=365 /DNA_ORIENTATION=+
MLSEDVEADDCDLHEPPSYGDPAYWEEHFAGAPSGMSSDPSALEYEWLWDDLDALGQAMLPYLPLASRR